MIVLVQGTDYNKYSSLIDQMFRLRADVFKGRLDWEVDVLNGREVDQFDDANPLYLMSVGQNGILNGSLRLLPSTGPTMLRDVFSKLLDDGDSVCSPIIWESTRFCVSESAASVRSDNHLNFTTGELLAGIVEVGMMAGLQSVVSVYDAGMKRVLRTAGCSAIEIGTPRKFGKVTTYAGLFPIDDEMLTRIRDAAGIKGSVLTDDRPELFVAA